MQIDEIVENRVPVRVRPPHQLCRFDGCQRSKYAANNKSDILISIISERVLSSAPSGDDTQLHYFHAQPAGGHFCSLHDVQPETSTPHLSYSPVHQPVCRPGI